MDDIYLRIQRMYRAVGAPMEQSVPSSVPMVPAGTETLVADFSGGLSAADLHNQAWAAISAIALLFDHLYTWLKRNGGDPRDLQSYTDASKPILIVRDLYNAEKHPNDSPNRSGCNPRLRNLRRVIRSSGIGFNLASRTLETAPGSRYVLYADVVNTRNGQKVAELEPLLAQAIADWERYLAAKGLTA